MASRKGDDCVKVALRVRPLIGIEIAKGQNETVITYPSKNQLQIGGDKCFTFDYVFDDNSQQKSVYSDAIKPLVDSFLQGYNATVIAYGQTGSGKTYTMGTLGCDDSKLEEEWGIIPSAIHDIFRTLQQSKESDDDFKVQCSFIEIYNEEIKDLLDPHTTKNMAIRENPDGPSKIHIPGMKLEVVENAMDMADALDRGGAARATAFTQMNSQSSRSHAIFTIHLHHIKTKRLESDPSTGTGIGGTGNSPNSTSCSNSNSNSNSRELTTEEGGGGAPSESVVIQSKFHFVDLAGSERCKKTGASGARMLEGISINAGLLALGNVISALGDPRLKSKHIPFRDSKITRLLQDSLGGNSRTMMIACVSPARSNMMETKSTLNYANRAKNIQNKAVVNRDPRSRQILKLRERVKELERQLQSGKGGGNGGYNRKQEEFALNAVANHEMEQQLVQQEEQIMQLQADNELMKNEVVKLQEKVKSLRLSESRIQDKYYREVADANTKVEMERRHRLALTERVRQQFPNFNADDIGFNSDDIKEEIHSMEKLKLENESLKKEVQELQTTISRNESKDQYIHSLVPQMAKVIRGDFTVINELNEDFTEMSPSKPLDVTSSTESMPGFNTINTMNTMNTLSPPNGGHRVVLNLLENTDNDDDDDDDDDFDEDGQSGIDTAAEEGHDDEDNDVSMLDPGVAELKRENEEKVQATKAEKDSLKQEKKITMVYKKQLMKEQKQHSIQMERIAEEQLSRERSQRLKSEKYNREIDKTQRDIRNLHTMLKQLCQQRQKDVGKQAFYEKQVNNLSKELEEAHRQGSVYEAEKSKLNPNDVKKLQAQEIKISNYQNKVKSLNLQIRSYKEKLGQIRKLQAMHKEDMLKMNQLTRKMTDLKRKKVDLQRKMTEENKQYARWKAESGKTIKQLRKIQREKNIQLQRHKTQLSKTTCALKQKTAALCNLKRRQKEMERKQNNNHRRQYAASRNTRNQRGNRGQSRRDSNVKQIKSKIAKLLRSLILKHQLFHKYKSFDREHKAMQHEVKEYELGLSEVNSMLRQLDRNQQSMTGNEEEDDDEVERTRLKTEKLEYEQRIEDTKSTSDYIKQQMIAMSYKMKELDARRWKQLQNAEKVSLSCTQEDLDQFITINNTQYARSCVNFLITQHLQFRLHIDDYKKEIKFLREEKGKIVANAANEMRKKMVLIEKLQNQYQLQHQKYRTEQILSAEHTIDDHEEEEPTHSMQSDRMSVSELDGDGNETDNDTMMALDETDNDEEEDMDIHHHHIKGQSPPRMMTPVPLETAPDLVDLDRQRMSDELEQNKKLLNLYRSPMHRSRSTVLSSSDRNPVPFPFTTRATSLSAASSHLTKVPKAGKVTVTLMNGMNSNKSNNTKFQTPFKRSSQVLPTVDDSRVSVQLTPFHTPQVKSKTRTMANASSGNGQSSYPSFLSASNTNGINNGVNHSMRSISTSPLGAAPRILDERNNNNPQRSSSLCNSNGNAMSISETAPDLEPINEQPVLVLSSKSASGGNGRRDVFSRLTNPQHYVSTSRTKAREQEINREKVRRQKVSHNQIQQKKASWKNLTKKDAPSPVLHTQSAMLIRDRDQNQSNHEHDVPMDHSSEMKQEDGGDELNKSVFVRLHKTTIRHTRHHLNNSTLHQEEAMVLPVEDRNGGTTSSLMNEPSRIFPQNEIHKKPQRNPQPNTTNKMILSQPVRLLTPDDDL